MRNIIRIFTFILAISIIFTACKKNDNLTERNLDPTEQKILKFKENMKSGNKSGETMSIEEAVWNIEAALNYTYCVVTDEIIGDGLNFDSNFDSITYEIEVNNNLINFGDITDSYLSIVSDMQTLLDGFDYEIKFFNSIDVDIDEGLLTARFFIRFADSGNKSNKYFWNINDDWHWGYDLGNCSQTVLERDLINEIGKWISYNRAVRCGVYYTDIVWEGIFYYIPNDELPEWEDHWHGPNDFNIKDEGGELFHATLYSEEHSWITAATSHYCVEESLCNYYASKTNQCLGIVEDEYVDPERHITSWLLLEHFNQDDNTMYPNVMKYWISHRFYAYSGIPHIKEQNQN